MSETSEILAGKLNLSQPVVDQAFAEIAELPSLAVAKVEEVAELRVHDKEGALLGLLSKLEDRPRGDKKVYFNTLGFIVACRTIRYAASDTTVLPSLPVQAVEAYATYAAYEPAWLDKNLERDYRPYPAIFNLIHSVLTDPNSQARAKLVFGLYGRVANPEREKFAIPAVPSVPQQRQPNRMGPEQRRMLQRINASSVRIP